MRTVANWEDPAHDIDNTSNASKPLILPPLKQLNSHLKSKPCQLDSDIANVSGNLISEIARRTWISVSVSKLNCEREGRREGGRR